MRLELCLLAGAGNSQSVAAVIQSLPDVAPVPCVWRAFLFEPEVVSRLEAALNGRPFLDAFAPPFVSQLEVARVLAVVSCPGGQWRPGESTVVSSRLAVADRYDRFPPRPAPLQAVVAFHPA